MALPLCVCLICDLCVWCGNIDLQLHKQTKRRVNEKKAPAALPMSSCVGMLTAAVSLLILFPAGAHGLRRFRLVRRQRSAAVLVKLGGSAVTEKAVFETVHEARLEAAAKAVGQGQQVIVVHGAGSFGHFQAKKYGVSKGTSDPSFCWQGFAETRSSVTRLNALVVSALLRQSVPAVGIPPFPRWTTRGRGVVDRSAVDEVRATLDEGLTPVLHGDAVLDRISGTSILSGDVLMRRLAAELKPRLAVFVTDVAGVFTRPPNEPGAALLCRILVDRRGAIVACHAKSDEAVSSANTGAPSMTTAAHDVTGGIAAKVDCACNIAADGTKVVIVEVGTVHAEAAMRGEIPEVCTVVERE